MNKSKVGGLKWNLMKLKPLEDQNSETKTKTEATNLKLNQSNRYETKTKSNPSNPYETKTKAKPLNRSTHQTQIIPIANLNLTQHHRVLISNPLPINPSNPPPINPSTTTKFPNQEAKTLDLHKTKLHGRKREEAPPHAYRGERENGLGWETMLPISSFN